MDIKSFKTVLLVQMHGSIAGAARALDVDPSSVSRIVAGVEADLGVRLFQRTTRQLTVTEEGQRYFSRVEPLIEEMEAVREEMRGLQAKPSGLLRMTASVAFTHQLIIPLLSDFQEDYPDITVDLQSSDTNLDLIENNIDLAIRLAPAPKGDLISTRLMKTRYHVVASPEYLKRQKPITEPNDLADLECLKFSLPELQDRWTFCKHGERAFDIPINGTFMFSNALAMHNAVCRGLGIAMLADWLVKDDVQANRLVILCPHYECTISMFETAAWILYPNRTYLPQKVRVMIDFLKKNLK